MYPGDEFVADRALEFWVDYAGAIGCDLEMD
jgi:hypothetical protein